VAVAVEIVVESAVPRPAGVRRIGDVGGKPANPHPVCAAVDIVVEVAVFPTGGERNPLVEQYGVSRLWDTGHIDAVQYSDATWILHVGGFSKVAVHTVGTRGVMALPFCLQWATPYRPHSRLLQVGLHPAWPRLRPITSIAPEPAGARPVVVPVGGVKIKGAREMSQVVGALSTVGYSPSGSQERRKDCQEDRKHGYNYENLDKGYSSPTFVRARASHNQHRSSITLSIIGTNKSNYTN